MLSRVRHEPILVGAILVALALSGSHQASRQTAFIVTGGLALALDRGYHRIALARCRAHRPGDLTVASIALATSPLVVGLVLGAVAERMLSPTGVGLHAAAGGATAAGIGLLLDSLRALLGPRRPPRVHVDWQLAPRCRAPLPLDGVRRPTGQEGRRRATSNPRSRTAGGRSACRTAPSPRPSRWARCCS